MAEDVRQGETWASTDTDIAAIGTHPAWVKFTASHTLGGTVQGPTGLRRLVWADTSLHRNEGMFRILPPADYEDPADIGAPWMAVISDRLGHYIMADGVRGIPCIGTPEVRLTDNGPSKAVLELAPGPYTWEDGHRAQIVRGDELAVWFRDADTDALVPVFRGAIRQVDKSLTVTVTAYDRVMDLAEFSDQYQPHNTHAPENSYDRTAVTETAMTYRFNAPIGQLVSARALHLVTADPLDEMDQWGEFTNEDTAIIPMVNYVNYPPATGTPITRVTTQIYAVFTSNTTMNLAVTFYLLTRNGTTFTILGQASTTRQVTANAPGFYGVGTDVNWTLPSGSVYIGVHLKATWNASGSSQPPRAYIATSTTRYFANGNRYKYSGKPSGTTFNAVKSDASSQPEVLVRYCTDAGAVPIADITVVSGNQASVPVTSIPGDISDDRGDATIRTEERGRGLRLDYYALDSIQVAEIVRELVSRAGMVPDLPDADLGVLSYYTSSTYDYLTCLHELIKGADYGLKDTITAGDGGTILIRPRHTLGEDAVAHYTAAPDGDGGRAIVQHQITQHWMAERATQAIIAESATTSGLPLAIETDDRLFADSLANATGSPMRGVSADNSAGTHALLAMSAGGNIKALHTNVVEGSITLAGYRLAVWDLSTVGEGGNTIRITIPDIGVDSKAIPTEIVLANGVTKVTLDNVRAQDRSEVARSMGHTADNVSNQARALPNVVYIFATQLNYDIQEGNPPSHPYNNGVSLSKASGGAAQAYQLDTAYLKETEDAAGYQHLGVYFPAPSSGAIAADDPSAIIGTRYPFSGAANTMPIDNPKYVLAGQSVHLDIRIPQHPQP